MAGMPPVLLLAATPLVHLFLLTSWSPNSGWLTGCMTVESWNNRIVEAGKTLQDHWVQPFPQHCRGQHKACPQPFLGHLQGW